MTWHARMSVWAAEQARLARCRAGSRLYGTAQCIGCCSVMVAGGQVCSECFERLGRVLGKEPDCETSEAGRPRFVAGR